LGQSKTLTTTIPHFFLTLTPLPIVWLGVETGLAIIATLNDVQGCTKAVGAWQHRNGDMERYIE
jgi:hypothetical protein